MSDWSKVRGAPIISVKGVSYFYDSLTGEKIIWDACPCCKIGYGYYVEYCPVRAHKVLALEEKSKGVYRRR
jgi:hypothetical protein